LHEPTVVVVGIKGGDDVSFQGLLAKDSSNGPLWKNVLFK